MMNAMETRENPPENDARARRPHHAAPGKSDEHFTPEEIFSAMAVQFDLDPAQPEEGRAFLSVPSRRWFTKSDDGLVQPWEGFVWLNPPFGGRNGVVPWLKRFSAHANGVVLVNAQTSCGWFHEFAPLMDAMLFPNGKTKFVQPDGTIAKQPPMGVVLMAMGPRGIEALQNAEAAGLGLLVQRFERIAA